MKQKSRKKRAHILVAEDDRMHQCYVESLLQGMGFEATVVSNGASVIDLLQTAHFDMILLDCNMPVMNGYEAAKKIADMRADGQIGDIPVIALTANQQWGDPEKCFESGMDGYIAKSLWLPKWKPRLKRMICQWLPLSIASPDNDDSTEDVINPVTLTKAKDLVGRKFRALVEVFLVDAKEHIDSIRQLAQNKAPAEEAVLHAYALTFSSRQVGAVQMARIAEKIMRRCSGLSKQNADCSIFLNEEIPDIEKSYVKTQVAFKELAAAQ